MDDEDEEFTPGVDGCTHGVGFDEDCEWCEIEMEEERRIAREARKRQKDMFGHTNRLL